MDRNPLAQELVALTDSAGFIRPQVAVDWARRHPESHLHKRLQWDDKLAGEQHRLDQVRQLIAVYVRGEDGHRTTISLVQDRTPEGGYRRIEQVMSNSDLRALALKQALDELGRWQERYQYLVELSRVFEAAADVKADLPPAPPPGAIVAPGAAVTEVAGA